MYIVSKERVIGKFAQKVVKKNNNMSLVTETA